MFAKRVAGNSSGSSKSSPCSRQLGKVPYLSEGDLDDLKLIWNVPECCKFDRIPDNTEFWTKSSGKLLIFYIFEEIQNFCKDYYSMKIFFSFRGA